MDKQEMLKQVRDIFVEVLDDENVTLTESTTADDVEGWDSLTHIQLVVAVEKFFKVRFTSKEIQSWPDVGAMLDSIIAKKA